MNRFIILLIIALLSTNVLSQNKYSNSNVDSLRKLSVNLLRQHNYTEANRVLDAILKRKSEIDDKWLPTLYNNKGIALYGLGEYTVGVKYYKKAIDTYKAEGRDTLYAQSLVNLGMAYKEIGADSLASTILFRAVYKFQDLKLLKEEASALNSLGNLYRDVGNFKRSEYFLKKALSIRQKIGYRKGVAYSFQGLGRLMLEKKDYEAARVYFFKSLHLKENLGLKSKTASTLAQLGVLHLEMNNCDSASYYMNLSVENRKKYAPNSLLEIGLNHLHLGEMHLKCGELDKSLSHLIIAQKDLESINAKQDLILVYENLIVTYKRLNDFKNAFQVSQQLLKLKSIVQSDNSRKELARLSIIYDIKGYQRELELKRIENSFLTARSNILISASIILLIAMMIITLLLRRSRKQKRKIEVQNESLIHQNHNIRTLHDELTHRTQNFFSLIRGMTSSDRDDRNHALINKQIARIDAMSEVQKHLVNYKTNVFNYVDLSRYLEQLLHYKKDLFSNRKSLSFKDNLEKIDLKVSYSLAARLGIILNELITNSLKHNENVELQIEINMVSTDSEIIFSYQDSGKFVHKENDKGKGMKLMNQLLNPVKGKILLDTKDHFSVVIKIPKENTGD